MSLRLLGTSASRGECRNLHQSLRSGTWEVVGGCPPPWRPCSPFSLPCVVPGPPSPVGKTEKSRHCIQSRGCGDFRGHRETSNRLDCRTVRSSDLQEERPLATEEMLSLHSKAPSTQFMLAFCGGWQTSWHGLPLFLVRWWHELGKCNAYQACCGQAAIQSVSY